MASSDVPACLAKVAPVWRNLCGVAWHGLIYVVSPFLSFSNMIDFAS